MAAPTSPFLFKVTHIFLPFLALALGLLVGYTFLHWLLLIKLELFQVKDIYVTFLGPFALATVFVFFWLGRRIKLLHLKRNSGDLPTLYRMVAVLAIGVPILVAQLYIQTATGILTPLPAISQIDKQPKTKYYTLQNYRIDKKSIGIYQETETTGKGNQNMVFTFYITCPIRLKMNPAADTALVTDQAAGGPLYVVDGEPIQAPTQPGSSSTQPPAIANLDKNDIASMSVVKDKAATSLFGERGREGVVLISTIPKGWLALVFSKSISNRLSDGEKEQLFKEFALEAQAKFERQDLENFTFLERLETDDNLDAYQVSLQKSPAYHTSSPGTVLTPHHIPFEDRNGNKFFWIWGSLGIGAAVWLFMLSVVKLASAVPAKVSANEEDLEQKTTWKEDLAFLLPSEGFTVTPILMYLNILAFVVLVVAGLGFITLEADGLYRWGANYRPNVLQGEVWRLLSSVFLHGGIMHLLMNMYGLLFIGLFLEPLLGTAKYLLLYLICGILASVASIWWNEAQLSVGASGAIFGLYGFYLALLTTNLYPADFRKSFLISISVFIGYNLIMGLGGGVDNAAHVGGLLAGFVLGYLFYFWKKREWQQEETDDFWEQEPTEH